MSFVFCDELHMRLSGFKAMIEFDLVKPDQCMIYKLAMYSGSDLGVFSRFKSSAAHPLLVSKAHGWSTQPPRGRFQERGVCLMEAHGAGGK